MKVEPLPYNPNPVLVKGYYYKVITFNSEFEFWTANKLKRKELKQIALDFIGDNVYELEDIESVRLIKNPDE